MKIDELKQKIAGNKTGEAIRLLLQKLTEYTQVETAEDTAKSHLNILVSQSAQCEEIDDKILKGIIAHDDAQRLKNGLNHSFTQLIDKLPPAFCAWTETDKPEKTITHTGKYTYDFFLSFSSKNLTEAHDVLNKLKDNYLRVFMSDADLKHHAGTAFTKAIYKAIDESEHFIILCTPEAMQSVWVEEEFTAFYTTCYIPSKRVRKLYIIEGSGFSSGLLKAYLAAIQTFKNINEFIASLPQTYIIENLKTEIALLKNDNSMLMLSLNKASNDKKVAETEIENLNTQLDKAKDHKEYEKTIEQLNATKNKMEVEFRLKETQLNNDKKALSEKVEKLNSEKAQLQQTLQRLQDLQASNKKQEEDRKRKEAEEQKQKPLINTIVGDFVFVKGGTFLMGDEVGDLHDGCRPVHEVKVSDFYMAKTPVTQKQWKAIMGNNPSGFKDCDDCPVENVSWNDAQEFIKKINAKTNQTFRLPTEAEWEYAAKGGNHVETQNFASLRYAGSDNIDDVAWHDKNSGGKTHPVAQKRPNELGIYDMSGNVWEWCNDWYDENYYKNSPKENPKGADTGSYRVLRGGSWCNTASYCRAAIRYSNTPGFRGGNFGFRLVRD